MKKTDYPAPSRAKENAWRGFVVSFTNLIDHMDDVDAAKLFDLRLQAERVVTKPMWDCFIGDRDDGKFHQISLTHMCEADNDN
ncbi:hypothetical protein C1J03_14505 [Sulfitobacter sp. SK012]|uniref:hypothetical protein n=1 Tax=Sulfitobacter sp. SK012 TaxID=1389005 RepID=UPI000E0A1C59|nr:hypothetical protein [Sulfitobacter sp. SK012]AXI47119.1 hypothetical protein C1J03_14505 [Sulfitobacter sp. SK012]